jgi:hypothetical protein
MDAKRKSANDTRSRADALILPTLGDIPCKDLSKEQIDKWLTDVAKSPARIRSKKTKQGIVERQQFKEAPADDEAKRKRRATANRTLAVLRPRSIAHGGTRRSPATTLGGASSLSRKPTRRACAT